MFRCIVAGDRRLRDYAFVSSRLDRLLADLLPGVVVVSGGSAGADSLGERYARERGLLLQVFPADSQAHGKKAGPLRNRRMARYAADASYESMGGCVVFDGGGPGSADMIAAARSFGLRLRVHDVRRLLEEVPS